MKSTRNQSALLCQPDGWLGWLAGGDTVPVPLAGVSVAGASTVGRRISSMVFDYYFAKLAFPTLGVSVFWQCIHCINVNSHLVTVNAQAMPKVL